MLYVIGFIIFSPVLILLLFVLWNFIVSLHEILEMVLSDLYTPIRLIFFFILVLILMSIFG